MHKSMWQAIYVSALDLLEHMGMVLSHSKTPVSAVSQLAVTVSGPRHGMSKSKCVQQPYPATAACLHIFAWLGATTVEKVSCDITITSSSACNARANICHVLMSHRGCLDTRHVPTCNCLWPVNFIW